jgi:2,4-dienoyl-CoA reductase-like NADH-dependent reductase (Old Yellow Enzyme family)
VTIPLGPGYQVPLAKGVATAVSQPVSAVGMITDAKQAEAILQDGVDVISIARLALRDPYWPMRAAHELGDTSQHWPWQYERGQFPKN